MCCRLRLDAHPSTCLVPSCTSAVFTSWMTVTSSFRDEIQRGKPARVRCVDWSCHAAHTSTSLISSSERTNIMLHVLRVFIMDMSSSIWSAFQREF